MFYKLIRYILFIGFTCCIFTLSAQQSDSLSKPQSNGAPAIDSVMAISPDYMPVFYSRTHPLFFNPLVYTAEDTSLIRNTQYDPFWDVENIYQTLGIEKQAHQSMVYCYEREIGFSMITLPYSLYFKQQKDLRYYDVKTSFTKLSFTYGITTENHFSATHAQRLKNVLLVVDLDGYGNDGYFLHQETNMLNLDALLHYQTKRDVYGFTISYILNHAKFSENGGITDYAAFANKAARDSSATNDLGGFNVLFSNATTLINTHDVSFQQYVNLKDKKGHYFGTITHTAQFKKLHSNFNDFNLNNDFYQNIYYINTDTTNDTLHYYTLSNAIQWSNYEPLAKQSDKNYFIRLAGGIRHEYISARMPFYIGNTYTLFARTSIRLFKVWDLYGNFAYSFHGYNSNDAIANVAATFNIDSKLKHYLGIEANFYRLSPDYFYSYYIGNNNLWYNAWSKQNSLKLGAFWTIYNYKVSFNYFMMDNYIFLDEHYAPTLCEKAINIVQLNIFAPLHLHNFSMEANMSLQHSTKPYIAVPLFAGKLFTAYSFRIFKNRLRLQIGADLMYNSNYFADAYNPILHQFYHQETRKTGNYLYFNADVSMQVERISFFFRGGNLIAGLISYQYFTTPNYPMQGRNFEIGIRWRFYD